MKIAFGLSSIRFREHEGYDALEEFLRGASEFVWIGETAEVFAAFVSADLEGEFVAGARRIGIILEHANVLPQSVVHSDGSLFAIGFNKCVAFVKDRPLRVTENTLNAPFYCFVEGNAILVAIHELGCVAFCLSTGERRWEIDTEIVEGVTLGDDVLVLNTSEGETHRIQLSTGCVRRSSE